MTDDPKLSVMALMTSDRERENKPWHTHHIGCDGFVIFARVNWDTREIKVEEAYDTTRPRPDHGVLTEAEREDRRLPLTDELREKAIYSVKVWMQWEPKE